MGLGKWPSFHFITVKDFFERHEFIQTQCEKYGLTGYIHVNDRYIDMNPKPIISGEFANQLGSGVGIVISHLRAIQNWFLTSDEEYTIFVEDDHDLTNVQNVDWDQFHANLPKDWECIQLIRMEAPLREKEKTTLELDMRYGRWWGGAYLIRKSWAKKILDRHVVDSNTFNLDISNMLPMIENVLFYNIGTIYNFPLFYENLNMTGTIKECSDEEFYRTNTVPHRVSILKIMSDWAFLLAQEKIDYKNLLKVNTECPIL